MNINGIPQSYNINNSNTWKKKQRNITQKDNLSLTPSKINPQANPNIKAVDLMGLYAESQASGIYNKQKVEDIVLLEDQINYLKGKYDLSNMTEMEQADLMQDLYKMGIISQEEASAPFIRSETQEELDFYNSHQINRGAYPEPENDFFDSITKQLNMDLFISEKMIAAGNDIPEHTSERVKSLQKILKILGQFTVV